MIELSDISRIDEDAMSLVVRCECGVVNKFEFDVPMGTSGNSEIIKPIESEQKNNDLHEDVKKMIVEDSETRRELEKISYRLEKLEKHDYYSFDWDGLVKSSARAMNETQKFLDRLEKLEEDVSGLKNAAGLWLVGNKTELTKDDIKTIKQMTKACARYGIINPEPKEPKEKTNPLNIFDLGSEDTGATILRPESEKKEVIRKCCKHTDCLRDLKDIVRGAQICRLIDDDCGYFVEETV